MNMCYNFVGECCIDGSCPGVDCVEECWKAKGCCECLMEVQCKMKYDIEKRM